MSTLNFSKYLKIKFITEGRVQLPPDLRELYGLYQQEIHAATFTADTPPSCFADTPIYGPPPTAGSSTGVAARSKGVDRLPPITQRLVQLYLSFGT